MPARILIAYASRSGSTAEIAQAIGKELESIGMNISVSEIREISSIRGYDAVVIGTPVYMGKPEKTSVQFAACNQEQLQQLPVAVFAVGMAPVDTKVGSVEGVIRNLQASFAALQPVATTLFAGRLDPARMSLLDRTMTRLMRVQTGDFRDWAAIRAWAQSLPALLKITL
ncbi:MAG: flavodoxin domain-containing protein [Methanomicrobiales archaeon]|nr:flavodoxin domain-containing protein [Methanomicrobiales archaeon]